MVSSLSTCEGQRAWHLKSSPACALAAGCYDLVHQIIPPHLDLQNASNPLLVSALSIWHHGHDEPPPSDLTSHCQKGWDTSCIQATCSTPLDESPDANTRAWVLAVATKKLGAWLTALSVSSLVSTWMMRSFVLLLGYSLVSLCVKPINASNLRLITEELMGSGASIAKTAM